MTLFGLFSVLSIALVVGQLDSVQHAALMTFYNETGAKTKARKMFFADSATRVQRHDEVPSLRGEPAVQWNWDFVQRNERRAPVRDWIASVRVDSRVGMTVPCTTLT